MRLPASSCPRGSGSHVIFKLACALFTLWSGLAMGNVPLSQIQGVFVGADPQPLLQSAVGELNNALDGLYGKRYIGLYTKPTAGYYFAVGPKAALATGWITQQELDSVDYGGYIIRTTANGVAIAGKRHFATKLGVQEYARILGYRKVGGLPRGAREVTVVNKPADQLRLPVVNVTWMPDMPMRNYYNRDDQARPDDALAVVNPELVQYSDLWIDHSAGYLIPKDMFYDTHPEYFALVNGKRIPKSSFTYFRTPLCLSNPDVKRISAERALLWVAAQPEHTIFPITYGDTRIWCECEPCRALDHQWGHHAGRLLSWVNHVANAVAAKYPDVHIITFAYGGSDMAPSNIQLADNVWIVASTGLDLPFFGHRDKIGELLPGQIAKLNSWVAHSPGKVWICEYSADIYHPGLPGQIADRLRWYHNLGISGIMYSYGYPSNFPALWSELYSRIMHDITTDERQVMNDFALNYYGDGGPAMARYLNRTWQRYMDTKASITKATYFNGRPVNFYSNTYIEQALNDFDEAMAKTDWLITKEIRPEVKQFALDALRRPGFGSLDTQTVALVHRLLALVRTLTPHATEAELKALGTLLYNAGKTADAERPGSLTVHKEWLLSEGIPLPNAGDTTPGMTQVWASDFLFGHGPFLYSGGHRGHTVSQVPVMHIYVPENAKGRSSRMSALFELYGVPQSSTATLALLGQDSDDPNVPAAEIRVELNNQVVFQGPTQLKKWDWGWQYITVPAGVLEEGVNQIAIYNISNPASITFWHQRWFMLVRARLTYDTP